MSNRQPAIIIDRDGTLASVEWCRHFVAEGSENKDWRSFNLALPFDPPVPHIAAILRAIRPGVMRIMTTGRTEDCRFNMFRWLRQHELPIDRLYMRKVGDQRKDSEVKREIMREIRGEGFDIRYVIDDRPQVCDMWREEGLKVMQVVDPGITPHILRER